uniref:C3H1-type domain-containing protein n=1 Tax=Brassica campestris TaxID=3711 RepID=M4F683_BRACM
MPSGKYYCDYCEKEFQDTQVARKRHLQSNPHLRAKALWYSSITSDVNNQQVSSFVPRGLCNRFVSSNFCPFGDSCRYLHPNNITGDCFSRRAGGAGWFDLPPSLRPPPEQGYPQPPSIDWG